jgi:hypothetical protein
MEMAAIPAMTPPTMAPALELLAPEPDEDPVKDALKEVMDTLEDALGEVMDTPKDALGGIVYAGKPEGPEGPKIVPGGYSGLSISNVVRS